MGEPSQDPSMEEILASIKRVIRDDSSPTPVPRANRRPRLPEPAPTASSEEDVLELDDPVAEDGLVSDDAASASREALAALSALRQREAASGEGGPLEAVVRDMLRPMLKDWLDEHLPQMVEALVTREIARITGRRL